MRFHLALIFVGFIAPLLGLAQNEDRMLIYQIDGNQYIRNNYDKNDKLKSYQSIEVGKLNAKKEILETKLTVVTYDKKGNMKGASQTTISCNPKVGEVMMGIFPFAGGASNKSLKIEVSKGKVLYPRSWTDEKILEDFLFALKFKGGAAGFFGTKSEVLFSNRKINKIEKGKFRITGKMTLKAYVLGIKISNVEYQYFEEIVEKVGIVRQKFTERNGNYFTIELKK